MTFPEKLSKCGSIPVASWLIIPVIGIPLILTFALFLLILFTCCSRGARKAKAAVDLDQVEEASLGSYTKMEDADEFDHADVTIVSPKKNPRSGKADDFRDNFGSSSADGNNKFGGQQSSANDNFGLSLDIGINNQSFLSSVGSTAAPFIGRSYNDASLNPKEGSVASGSNNSGGGSNGSSPAALANSGGSQQMLIKKNKNKKLKNEQIGSFLSSLMIAKMDSDNNDEDEEDDEEN